MNALVLVLSLAARPDDANSDDLFRFDPGDVVLAFETERFSVHYTIAGDHAVPPADTDASGVPDHVEQVGAIYEEVLDFYEAFGFRAPVSDGDARFDVYLVDFNLSADGAFVTETCNGDICAGYLVQENDFAGYGYPSVRYANRLLASHEFFHAIQAAYDVGQGAVISEGTAVWGSDRFDADLDDLEFYSASYLDETSRPITSDGSGPVDPFTYGSAIFWEFLAQKYGPETIALLFEATVGEDDSFWIDVIDTVLDGDTFADAWIEFAKWTVFTDIRADAAQSFAQGGALPPLVVERGALPYEQARYVVFVASFRTIAVRAESRASIDVLLTADEANSAGVAVAIYALDGNTVVGDVVRGLPNERITVDMGAASELWVQIINTRKDGAGARPAVCIGDASEVDACAAADDPPPPPPPPVESCDCGGASAALLLPALLFIRRSRSYRT